MHDLDRTMFETGAYEAEDETFESEDFLGSVLAGELGQETEASALQEMQELLAGEVPGSELVGETPELPEGRELALASELLEVTNEAELDRFIGNLLGGAVKAVGNFARSDTGRALGGVLKNAAKQALPIAGRAVGNWAAPGAGGDVGARLGQSLGSMFGLELEGLSQEDREFEVARAFVRFADAAAKKAATAPAAVPPASAVRASVTTAAREHAPGLVPIVRGVAPARARSGRWVRKGSTVVIYGV